MGWIMLYNLGIGAMFCYLAVHFDKWWIMLFSLFTIMSVRSSSNKETNDDKSVENSDKTEI